MGSGTQKLAGVRTRLVVERMDELRRFENWLLNSDSPTIVLSVSGIGGIGKTTFLGQIGEQARRYGIATACVDGFVGFINASEFLSHLSQQLGLGDTLGIETVGDVIKRLSRWLSSHKTILLFDHFEEMMSLESFIRTELIPNLPSIGVMLVLASRSGLSMGWRSDPALITRTERLILNNFTWEQSIDYIKRAGIDSVDLQQRISHEASGYPLALALKVQSALQDFSLGEDDGFPLHEITSDLIREVAPRLNEFVEGLIFLRTSTQDVLSDVLQRDVSMADFSALSRLSFVRRTEKGLVIHDVVRAYLLGDLKSRNPRRFDALFQRTVRVLGTKIEESSGRMMYDLSRNLVTLCIFATPVFTFPDSSIPMQLSPQGLPPCEAAMESDVAELHRLIDRGIVTGMTASGFFDHHDMLDFLVRNFPESIRVIRYKDGRPAAFATFLPLCEDVLTLLPKCTIEVLQESLSDELSSYEQAPFIESDTTLSLISCVPVEASEYTFLDLLLSLKVTGWTELAQGKRCLLFSSLPEVNAFYTQLGYEHLSYQRTTPFSVDVYKLDFRVRSMGKWMVDLLIGGQPKPLQTNREISLDTLRDALKHIQDPSMLQYCEFARALRISAKELQAIVFEAIFNGPPAKPLTESLQNILRVSYFHGHPSATKLSRELNIGRTTYYRYLNKALSALLEVLNAKIAST